MGKVGLLLKNYCCSASFKIISIHTVVPIAVRATTAAAMARILSIGLNFVTAAGACAGRRAAGAVVAGETGAAAPVRGWAAGVADERKVVAAGGAGGIGAPEDAPVGPPGGSVGSLMVGAAVGLGGKLMRTVSFFG